MNYYELIFVILVILLIGYNLPMDTCSRSKENFTNDEKNLVDIIKNINLKNLRYNYYHDILTTDILAHKILDNIGSLNVSKTINEVFFEVYKQIRTNQQLLDFIKFNNLIDENGDLIFQLENPEIVMLNQLKILMLVISSDDLNKIKNHFTVKKL